MRLEQHGRIAAKWSSAGNNREAKYDRITKPRLKAMCLETDHWKRMSALVEKLLAWEA